MSSTAVGGVLVAVTLLVFAGFDMLISPMISRDPLAEPFLEIDGAEEKAWLDSPIVIEIPGVFTEEEIRESLEIVPAVPIGEEDLVVERVAKLPWNEWLPWAKTRVTINPQESRLFEPETSYAVRLKDEILTFETITLPRVVDAHVDLDPGNDFNNVPTTSPILLVFNEGVAWEDEFLDLEPSAEVTMITERSSGGGTQLWVAPKERWENSTTYTLTIREGVVDVFGHEGVEQFSLEFTTWRRPRVVEATPVGGHLPLDTTVRVKFERPVDRETVEQAFRVEPNVAGTFEWETDLLATWRPDALEYSKTYVVSAGGKSVDGDPFEPHEWSFTTHDPPVSIEIVGSDRSPTLLRAVTRGGTGEYSYSWSDGEISQEIWVDLWYGETRSFEVTVSSGDQTASAELRVVGPPSPCPEGWQIITGEVCYREEVLPGPVRVFVTRVDLRAPDVQLRSAPASDFVGVPSTVSTSALSRATLVSVNGDFFDLAHAEYFTASPIVSGGNFVYAPQGGRIVLALGPDLSSWAGRADELQFYVSSPAGEWKRLETINEPPDGDGLTLFNSYWGERLSLNVIGCYALFVPTDPVTNTAYKFSCGALNDIPLAAGEFVLVAMGEAAEWMKQNIEHPLSIDSSFPLSDVDFVVGGSHVLIQNGEAGGGSLSAGKHPRTAIGIDEEGFAYLVVADGRSSASIGMSLAELQMYLDGLGLLNAINLDGGGSSTMVLRGSVMNTPSDGRERSVASVVEFTQQHVTCRHDFVRC
jgi:hypothetical protein